MLRTQHEVRTEDGRLLLVEVAGPEHGDVVFCHHGTPGSRYRDDESLGEGAARGLRHVSYSRPGYEGSDRLAGRRVADCAADLRAIIDQLELEPGFVVGESGGGPHALAHAALLPDWVRGVAVLVGPAPYDAEGLDWLGGMAKENVEEFEAVMAGDETGLQWIEGEIGKIEAAEDLSQLFEIQGDRLAEADRESLSKDAVSEYLMAVWSRIVAGGPWGWLDDMKAITVDWGFGLDQVDTPVAVWHGEDDRAVPVAHGKWVADHLPNATFHLLRGEGHSSPLELYGKVLDDLLEAGS